jgi:putative membrane protein
MLNDTSLVALIAMVDRSEAEIGQLAVTKATNAEVKAYARAMVSDHRADLTRITRLAANSKIMLPSSNAVVASGNVTSTSAGTLDTSRVGTGSTTTGAPSENRSTGGGTSSTNSTTVAEVRQSMMQTAQQLASQKGSAFDGAYMDAMVTGHQRVLDVLQQNASSATNAEVRMHVTNVQADVMKHLQRAKEIQQKLGSATASPNSPAK